MREVQDFLWSSIIDHFQIKYHFPIFNLILRFLKFAEIYKVDSCHKQARTQTAFWGGAKIFMGLKLVHYGKI